MFDSTEDWIMLFFGGVTLPDWMWASAPSLNTEWTNSLCDFSALIATSPVSPVDG